MNKETKQQQQRLRVGIIFGGQSREREVSFAGGRTVYDNLNKIIFEPIPIFIDSLGNFILLHWEYLYKGTIRDFYPPNEFYENTHNFKLYLENLGELSEKQLTQIIETVGKPIAPQELTKYIDFAFLTLHGPYGEDGSIQGLLSWYGIPYSGSGILGSSIGINKAVQNNLLQQYQFNRPKSMAVYKNMLNSVQTKSLLANAAQNLGFPFVIKPAQQGSSIGVTIIKQTDTLETFSEALRRAFFSVEITKDTWEGLVEQASKLLFLQQIVDIKEGIGLPVYTPNLTTIYSPQQLCDYLEDYFNNNSALITLTAVDNEQEVIIEQFLDGKEFSCIVIQDQHGQVIALPPTEIVKNFEVFDYRAKYLPGIARKITPIQLPNTTIRQIQAECCKLFNAINAKVYARIDGFLLPNNQLYLNDPNTTSGMLPSSFFFHQAAEIGLNPSQFITYIIHQSLIERIKEGKNTAVLQSYLQQLNNTLNKLQKDTNQKIKVGVILGGYSSERHISVESGRNIYEKLFSSNKYEPIPIFLTGNDKNLEFYELPINLLLKDNADDIASSIIKSINGKIPTIINETISKCKQITQQFAGNILLKPKKLNLNTLKQKVDVVFIALHGRPGEDGHLQSILSEHNIPYNGSDSHSSKITINKFETNKLLRSKGILVAESSIFDKKTWIQNKNLFYKKIEASFTYPFIVKPIDDGCSSGVKLIQHREALNAYCKLIFRAESPLFAAEASLLQLSMKEEFPQKNAIMVEELIQAQNADHFLEITGGILTHRKANGKIHYEIFEPSETLASKGILSLEEKFLAGEGQNITPARYSPHLKTNKNLSKQIRKTLKRVSEILNLQGYARIDAFVRINAKKAETIIVEINSLPGMTPATCIFHQAALNKYKPYDFIDAILQYALNNLEK